MEEEQEQEREPGHMEEETLERQADQGLLNLTGDIYFTHKALSGLAPEPGNWIVRCMLMT